MSSTMTAVGVMSPTIFIAWYSFVPDKRRLSTIANCIPSFLAILRARLAPPACAATITICESLLSCNNLQAMSSARNGSLPYIIHEYRVGIKVVHRQVEKSLDLRGMKVKCEDSVRSRGSNEACY